MTNLLEETIIKLGRHNLTPEDVEWVGLISGERIISWQGFERLANFDYDSGYGGNEVRLDLVVVGKDWWLERHEYDGSEWWEFKKSPKAVINPGRLYILKQYDVDEFGDPDTDPVKDTWEEYKDNLLIENQNNKNSLIENQ